MYATDHRVIQDDVLPSPGENAYYIEGSSHLSMKTNNSIVDLAECPKKTKCSEPHDKLFAVLNIVDQRERQDMVLDCNGPVSEIYAAAADAALKADHRALCMASLGVSNIEGLPSWAIDFTAETPELNLGLREHFMSRVHCSKQTPFRLKLSHDAKLLTLSGRFLGQVQAYVNLPIPTEVELTNEELAPVWQVYDHLSNLRESAKFVSAIEQRPRHCLIGEHDDDCVKFHATLRMRFKTWTLRRLVRSDITIDKAISRLNALNRSRLFGSS